MTSDFHQTVLLSEAIDALNIKPNGLYIDGTFGRGGHSSAILDRLNDEGHLISIDQDPQAIEYGQKKIGSDKRITLIQANFDELSKIIREKGWTQKVDGILLDLGISSPQVDNPDRGFSFLRNGPLDMRMNPNQSISAQSWLNEASLDEIAGVLKKYGEEPFARLIAKHIAIRRETKTIDTTQELADLIKQIIPQRAQKPNRHPATQTFQAIRIFINQELKMLENVLPQALEALTIGGRLVVISFHSLEDRIVKHFFQSHTKINVPKGVAIPEKELKPNFAIKIKRLKPNVDEITQNPRARSATLRAIEKLK